jgi:hypothetical protein
LEAGVLPAVGGPNQAAIERLPHHVAAELARRADDADLHLVPRL